MKNDHEVSGFLKRAVLYLTSISGTLLLAALPQAFAQSALEADSPSESREILLKGGYVLSMDPDIGDLPTGDVHIRDGQIIEVAPSINAPRAEIIDARNRVVMPGFVETHWHMWNSSWRGMANDAAEYFRFSGVLAPVYTVDDHYIAVRYAALDALNAGITTVHNWSHGMRGFDDARAEMQALVDTGIRAKMGYMSVIQGELVSSEDLSRAAGWIDENGQGRLGLGLLVEGGSADQFETAVERGRALGLMPITDHGGGLGNPAIAGPEFMVTHGTGLTQEAIQVIAEKGLKVALSPLIDPMIGGGLPPVFDLLTGDVPLENISFSVDVSAQTAVDPFASVRSLVNAARMQQVQAGPGGETAGPINIPEQGTQWIFSYRDALFVGTYGGANVLGLQNQIGSLTPGKRADVIMVRTDMINMLPLTDVNMPFQLVQHGLPSNVDTVIVDGQIRKRNGVLLGVDMAQVVEETAQSQQAIRMRAGEAIDTSR